MVWENEQKVPYAYKGDVWVGYDNVESIKIKVDYAKKMNLGGLMVWSIETDDFHGKYGKAFPLLNAVNDSL